MEALILERRDVDETGDDRTVLNTEVKTQQELAGARHTLPGNVNGNPNATPGAQTSGANSPRK